MVHQKNVGREGRARPLLIGGSVVMLALLAAGPVRAGVERPRPTAPAPGAVTQFLPAFSWSQVAKADRYEIQISSDRRMNSPLISGESNFFTRNTRATLTKTVPNGTYYWRVRAVGVDGSVSPWSPVRSFTKKWSAQPVMQMPLGGDTRLFPIDPIILRWSGVPGAAQYLVSVANDPALTSLVWRYPNQDDPNGPPNIAATSAAIQSPLPTGTYYWNVVPVDAEGNRGTPSPVWSFKWVWPSETTATVTDLSSSPEVYDPKFSWDPVPGAARYEVEVNPSADFAPGSKVCCTGTTIATSLSPSKVFKNDTYHWRIRAIDKDDNAGLWVVGPTFQKTFDNVPQVTAPSVKNLHMRDNLADPGTDQDPLTLGYQTQVPVIVWDPVPGASSYEVDVAPYTGVICDWGATPLSHHWRALTAVPAWTPLGNGWNGTKPYSDPLQVANEVVSLSAGSYCARVRARTDRDTSGDEVYGDYTYLDDGTGRGTAFEWTGYPAGDSAGCSGYPCSGDYVAPVRGSLNRRTPYFTWKAITGAQSYFVLVSKDPNFTSIVDYGFTHVPAYAPRAPAASSTRSYTDETTSYYWAVLPASGFSGSGAAGDPLAAAGADFQKQSLPPTPLAPAALQTFADQPTFQWSPVDGARRYRLQVAADTSFSNLLDDVTTNATSYSSDTTYPADTVLYWRVRADDENLNGLTWSTNGSFRKTLAAPVPSSDNPSGGDALPVWRWSPVQGASSYDITVDLPDGTHRSFSGLRVPAASFIKMTGMGIWRWRVRAEFPQDGEQETPGPYSATQTFTRTLTRPAHARTDSVHNHVLLRWDPRLGADSYKVQISSSPDFSRIVEQASTEIPSFAPTMTGYGYRVGGPLYWRVAAVDADRNQGGWTLKQKIHLLPRLRLMVLGTPRRGMKTKLMVKVQEMVGQPVRGALVRMEGAGTAAVAKRTGTTGGATFTVRPRTTGKLVFTATKAGFQPEYAVTQVR